MLIAHVNAAYLTREQMKSLPLPEVTRTYKPVAHWEIVDAISETLNFRNFQITREEFAATQNGEKCFGVIQINHQILGCELAIGFRNSTDKTMKLGLVAGYRVFVCDNLAFNGEFHPVLAKHSNSLNLIDLISVGVDRIQRHFLPMEDQIRHWQEEEINDAYARERIYKAFVETGIKNMPRHLLWQVHDNYFNSNEFPERTYWSLSNAFTSALKELEPVKRYQLSAGVGQFLTKGVS